MEIAIGFLVLSCLLVLFFIGFVLIGYHFYLSPQAIRKESVVTQAKVDFQRARGTAHLAILRQAYTRTNWQVEQCAKELETVQKQIAALQSEQEEKLRATLERLIAYTRLTEAKGIGPKMRDRILATTFRSRLTDLTQAYRVQGVGSSKQQAINAWIHEYSRQLPILLSQNFDGKSQIVEQYQSRLRDLYNHNSLLTHERENLQSQLQNLRAPIQELEKVRVADFVHAIQNPTPLSDNVDKYLMGLFPEWETPPEWFSAFSIGEAH